MLDSLGDRLMYRASYRNLGSRAALLASLALQAHLNGWAAHAMGGFDHAIAARNLNLPEHHALHAIVAVGRRGDASQLPEALQARETQSPRKPLSQIAGKGGF